MSPLLRLPAFLLLLAAPLLPAAAQSAPAPIDSALAHRYFAEARSLRSRDAGQLWGHRLDAPILFAEPGSRALMSDQPDSAGVLSAYGAFFSGTLPAGELVANTGLHWSGRTWAMIRWPPIQDSLARQVLLAHELWHGVQDSLGLPGSMPGNHHLGTRDGRLWLRLEARALRAAVTKGGAARRRAVEDAVAFRRNRRLRFPGSADDERRLELNEGLAEYTGVTLAADDPALRRRLVLDRLISLDSVPHFERDFAYHTGPAWGLLLDDLAPQWRQRLRSEDDLAELALAALGGSLRPAPALAVRTAAYGYRQLSREEDRRARAAVQRAARLEARFVHGPLLELPLSRMKMSFDPGMVEALQGRGSIYGMLRLTDRWGVLQCDGSGGLITSDFGRAVVPAPADTVGRRLTGPGWVLELLPGWRIAPGTRRGDWTLVPSP